MQGPWFILFLVQWVVVLVLVLLVAGILRQLSTVEERWNMMVPPITSYERGQHIADFELPNAVGSRVRMTDLLQQFNGALLLFATTTCPACENLFAQVEEVVARSSEPFTTALVVIAAGKEDRLAQLVARHPNLRHAQLAILVDEAGVVFRQFGITAVPLGLALDRQGKVTHQSQNPHVDNWLYARLAVTPPVEPVSSGLIGVITPAGLSRK